MKDIIVGSILVGGTLAALALTIYTKRQEGKRTMIGLGTGGSTSCTTFVSSKADDADMISGCATLGGEISALDGGLYACKTPIGANAKYVPEFNSINPADGSIIQPTVCPDVGLDVPVGNMRKIDCIAIGGRSPLFTTAAATDIIPCITRMCPRATTTQPDISLEGLSNGGVGYGVVLDDVPAADCSAGLGGEPLPGSRCLMKYLHKG